MPWRCDRLAIRKAELGDPSELGGANRIPDTAQDLKNLALLYDSQGRY